MCYHRLYLARLWGGIIIDGNRWDILDLMQQLACTLLYSTYRHLVGSNDIEDDVYM